MGEAAKIPLRHSDFVGLVGKAGGRAPGLAVPDCRGELLQVSGRDRGSRAGAAYVAVLRCERCGRTLAVRVDPLARDRDPGLLILAAGAPGLGYYWQHPEAEGAFHEHAIN